MPCRWRGCGGRWQPPCARCVGDALGPKLPQEHPRGPGCPRQRGALLQKAMAGIPKVDNVSVSARGCVNVASVQLLAFQAQEQRPPLWGHHLHLTEGPLVFKCLQQGCRCHWCPNPRWWGQRAPCPALLKPEQRWAQRLLCPLALADGDLPSPSTSTSRRLTRSWPGSLRPRGS